MPREVSISSIGSTTIGPDANIYGKVTLVWPYSSSTESFALLLGPVDIRARSQQGQIRVRFTGPAARQVAECNVGIADELRISLDGARWSEETEVRTPGRNVHGELVYKNRLHLEIVNDGAERVLHIDVDQHAELPHASTPVTPRQQVLQLLLGPDAVEDLGTSTHESPAFRSTAKSVSYDDDPFTSDVLDSADSRKRSRISFGQVKRWRVSQKSPSPVQSRSSEQGASSFLASIGDNVDPADEVVTKNDDETTPVLTTLTLVRERPSNQARLAASPRDLQSTDQAHLASQVSFSAVPIPLPDIVPNHITSPIGAASSIMENRIMDKATTRLLTPEKSITIAHDTQESSTTTPSMPRPIASSVMTSLFGTQPPADNHERVGKAGAIHEQRISDFDIAALHFSHNEVDLIAPPGTSEQGSVTGLHSISAGRSLSENVQSQPSSLTEQQPEPDDDIEGRCLGLFTKFGYYSRLGTLDRHLNATNGSGSKVDVLGVVSKSTSTPIKLEQGPRDYFTSLHVRDQSAQKAVRVDIYRSYRASLPWAQVGDVVLLRAFAVKSYKHNCFLKSSEESAWCVWRFGGDHDAVNRASPDAASLEDISGPPVEYGDEERREAWELEDWFLSLARSTNITPSLNGTLEVQ